MKVESPAEVVTVCCVPPVDGLFRTTLAPATRAPPGSATSPLILPLPAWASATEPAQRRRRETERKFSMALTLVLPLFIDRALPLARSLCARRLYPFFRAP